MDRFSELEAFRAVGREESFTAAAKSLGLTASAVSKKVRALEDRLGVRLLDRTTRSVSPTEAGIAFLERITAVLNDIDEAEQSVTRLQTELRGTLRVGAPMDFGRMHLTIPIATFAAAHPDVALEVEFSDRFVDMIREGFDVVVRIGTLADESFIARALAPCRRVLCAAPAYLDARGRPETAADLVHHERIGYAYETEKTWTFETATDPVRTGVATRHVANNGEMIRQLVLAGTGIALLPTFIVAEDLRAGRMEIVLAGQLDADIGIHAIYPHRRHLSAKVRGFVDHLVEHCGSSPYWDRGLSLE